MDPNLPIFYSNVRCAIESGSDDQMKLLEEQYQRIGHVFEELERLFAAYKSGDGVLECEAAVLNWLPSEGSNNSPFSTPEKKQGTRRPPRVIDPNRGRVLFQGGTGSSGDSFFQSRVRSASDRNNHLQ